MQIRVNGWAYAGGAGERKPLAAQKKTFPRRCRLLVGILGILHAQDAVVLQLLNDPSPSCQIIWAELPKLCASYSLTKPVCFLADDLFVWTECSSYRNDSVHRFFFFWILQKTFLLTFFASKSLHPVSICFLFYGPLSEQSSVIIRGWFASQLFLKSLDA